MYVKVNADRCFVVVAEDLVAEAIDETSLTDGNITHDHTLGHPHLPSSRQDVRSITEFTDTGLEAKSMIGRCICAVGQRVLFDRTLSSTHVCLHGLLLLLLASCFVDRLAVAVTVLLLATFHCCLRLCWSASTLSLSLSHAMTHSLTGKGCVESQSRAERMKSAESR